MVLRRACAKAAWLVKTKINGMRAVVAHQQGKTALVRLLQAVWCQSCCHFLYNMWRGMTAGSLLTLTSVAVTLQGKTTLARSLLAVPGTDFQLHDGTATSQEQFDRDPESLCSTISWEDEEDRVKWVWKVSLVCQQGQRW